MATSEEQDDAALLTFAVLALLGHLHAWRFSPYGFEVWSTSPYINPGCQWLDGPFFYFAWSRGEGGREWG